MAAGGSDPLPPRPSPDAASSSFSSFDRLLDTCRRTRAVLVAVAYEQTEDEEQVRTVLAREALAHVDAVVDGLTLLARAGSFTAEELRTLVRRAGIIAPPRPGTPEALGADFEAAAVRAAAAGRNDRPAVRPVDGRSMLAAGHARVAFSMIPRLPPEAVAWPQPRRTYADIPVPRTEGELLLRAEELARVLWRIAAGDGRRDEAMRRTLAFYEAGARLSVTGAFRAA